MKAQRIKTAAKKLYNPANAFLERRELLDRNPFFWLFRPRRQVVFPLLYYSIFAVGVAALGFLTFEIFSRSGASVFERTLFLGIAGAASAVMFLMLALQVASQSSMSFAEAKRQGFLELLFSTPIRTTDIIRGQWLAIRKSLYLPLILFLSLLTAIVCLSFPYERRESLVWFLKPLVEAGLELYVLGWVGMWMGLTSKSANRAFFGTIVLGLIVPYFFCTPTIINQAVLIAIAANKVHTQFRRFVAEQYLQAPGYQLAPVLPAETSAPPVIR